MKNNNAPEGENLMSLKDLTPEKAREMLEKIRWPEGPVCPRCELKEHVVKVYGGREGLYRCNNCAGRKQFTVTVGTIFEDSHLPLNMWVLAFHKMCASKKGVSAMQLSRELGVTYKTAWHMAHRVRLAMKQEPMAGMLQGKVEVDETYIGGKPRFPGTGKRGRGTTKACVMVLVERDGKAVNYPPKRLGANELKGAIREVVDRSATIYTDENPSYMGLRKEFAGHEHTKHSKREYVRGDVHSNTAESYFALLKRGVHGAFHHVSKKHLTRYCDEFAFRWNFRKANDGDRMIAALKQTEGKRLTYRPLTSE
jgi:transposase-like protein